jgi:acyl-CoA hydrolase
MAEHLLKYMENGDCVQLGIGVIPTAICKRIAASGFKHMGVHTEMLQTGLMDLIDSGSVDNTCKEYDYGKSVWNLAFPFDDKRYYDFVHKDERLCARDIYYTNNWVTLSRIPHLVALNNFTAIDLFGQSCASNYAGRIISNTGGQFEFTIGASLAKGGRGVQAATSTRKEKDGKVVSRIEPGLPPYTTVDIPAQFQQFVLTEYGIVDLRGLDGYERAKGLISIAHPDFREELEKAAYELHMVPPKFPISFDLKDRPFPDYHKERRDWKSPYMYMDGVTFENDVISGK